MSAAGVQQPTVWEVALFINSLLKNLNAWTELHLYSEFYSAALEDRNPDAFIVKDPATHTHANTLSHTPKQGVRAFQTGC